MRKEPIAVIGIGCRLPGANSPQEFWKLLHDNVDAITEVPPSRWDLDAFYDPDPTQPHKMSTRWGGFLENIDQFDPTFFGITPREANSIDPQQRLILEVAWEALEDAGQVPQQLSGSKTGVFIGISSHDYSSLVLSDDPYALTGNVNCIAANRISYVLNFRGPSLVVDTACSSSLVAVHLACQSLWNHESTLALAGGVQVILAPGLTVSFSKASLLSPDGRCKTFDAQANGYVRSEGAGVVLLKPLAQAQQDGDPIYAVILGSAVNQDGRSNGLSAPNPEAQEAVVREAYRQAGVSPGQVQYVEAHGTGTKIGDPMELKALGAVLAENRAVGDRCAVGSVKTNLGHSETAAGITGFIKVALALKHQQIPASLNFKEPNPYIDFDALQLRVQQTLEPWPYRQDAAALAGINSFGFGGTNAHVVLQEAPRPEPKPKSSAVKRPWHLLTLSAKSEQALRALSVRYQTWLAQNPMLSLADVCHGANTRRSQFKHRLALVGASSADMQAQLTAFAAGEADIPGLQEGQVTGKKAPRVAFLFTGQGSQYVGMGRALYESQPMFRAILDHCDQILQSELKISLLSVLYPDAEGDSPIDDTAYTQPALFALEYALAQLWIAWGITPSVVLGHSVGEYVAACVAGVFSLEEGLRLIAARGRLMQALPQDGSMVAVLADETQVTPLLQRFSASVADSGCVAIAAINGSKSIVISGQQAAIAAIVTELEAKGIKTKPLQVSHAFHSPLMQPMLAEFAQVASTVTYTRPRISLISNLTGDLIGAEIATPEYWCLHICQPVKFAASMNTLGRQEYQVFLEIGPKPTLLGMGKTCLPDEDHLWLPSLRPGFSDWQQMLQSLGALYLRNAAVDWAGFEQDYARQWVNLPTYPFQRQRYWWSEEELKAGVKRGASQDFERSEPSARLHPLLGVQLPLAGTSELRYQSQLGTRSPAYLQDHCVLQQPILPASAYLEIAMAAAVQAFQDSPWQLENVVIEQPLVLHEKLSTLQVQVTPEGLSSYAFQIFSLNHEQNPEQSPSVRHATGKLVFAPQPEVTALDLAQLQADCPQALEVASYYRQLQDRGLHYGSSFQGIQQLWKGENQALARIQLPPAQTSEAADYTLHPALLDACFQVLGAADINSSETFLPVGLGHLKIYSRSTHRAVWCHARLRSFEATQVCADLDLLDETGAKVAEIEGFTLRAVSRRMLQRLLQQDVDFKKWLYEIVWQPSPRLAIPAAEDAMAQRPSATAWLIFADSQGMGAQLGHQLQAQGESCVLVFAAQQFERVDARTYHINPANPEDFKLLLRDLLEAAQPLAKVIHLWSLAESAEQPFSVTDLEASQLQGCGSALYLVQALSQAGFSELPRLWLVTQGAQSIGTVITPLQPQQSSLWGLGRTIALEHPDLHCTRLDLDPETSELSALVTDLRFPDAEDQIAYRQGERYVARLAAHIPPNGALQRPSSAAFQLKISSYGILENLTLAPLSRRAPSPGEVEIQVDAAGLNFRDVLNALGMLQAYLEQMGLSNAADVPFGGECAGRIVALGEGVADLKVGDTVIAANAIGSMANFVTVPAQFVVCQPEHLSAVEAATLSTAFLTAYYGLNHLANIQAGDRILIHAAAGGVGQAAVQIAQRAGATVFATASPAKWDFLRSMGIEHTFNSRTLDFAEEIMDLTEGEGVNIVLNSLNGDFIPKNLEVLAPNGRFIEIGKLGIWAESEIHAQRGDVAYYPFDLLEVSLQNPALITSMLRDLMQAFEAQQLQPLPHQVFPIEEAVSAFRYMAQAKHKGKVVLAVAEEPAVAGIVREDSSYIVTGGMGALGLQIAHWLVDQGARTLVLTGRSSPSEYAQQEILRLEQKAQVRLVKADVSQPADVQAMFQTIQFLPPLRGIIHAAGVLDDGVLQGQSWARFEQVMAPKVAGAWNLHRASLDLPLDFFVCFSSVAALLGSPGQGNYAAANAFMDGLAHYRQGLGLPALSLNWGPWGGTGMAADLSDRNAARLALSGITPLDPEYALQSLEELLTQDIAQVGVVQIDWSKFLSQISNGSAPPFLEQVAVAADAGAQSYSAFRLQLEAASAEERRILLTQHIQAQIAKVMGLGSAEEIELDRSFVDLGMDSLMGMELKSRLQASLNCSFPITLAMDYPTVGALIGFIEQEVLSLGASSTSVPEPKVAPQRSVSPALPPDAEPVSLSADEAALKALGNGHQPSVGSTGERAATPEPSIPAEFYQFELSPEYLNLKEYLEQGKQFGNPFFTVHEGIAKDTTCIEGQDVINYSSYNYLGLSGDYAVSAASKAAIDRYGTSVSASRVVSGERSIHQDLERAIADFLGTEGCIVYIGGHTTNVSTIGHLFGKNDLIVYDALSHNSIQIGCALSGATALPFVHNDVRSLEQILQTRRHEFEKVLIAVEGVYSTDGDLAPLPAIVALKKRYKAFLIVDEAHSIGTVGAQGRGVGEHFGIAPADVDLWMGTLSKSFASCGGYIAASAAMVEYLKYTSPGFVYSVGMTPSNAASALVALERLQAEPDRVTRLQQRTQLFLSLAKQQGFDTGTSHDSPVVPIIIGDPYKAVQISHTLLERGINAQPMIYPSVPYDAARLRFFLSCDHTEAQIRQTIDILAEEIAKIKGDANPNDWLHYLMRSQFVAEKAASRPEQSLSG